MKVAFIIVLTLFFVAGAFLGRELNNDFILYLCSLLAFAPITGFILSRK